MLSLMLNWNFHCHSLNLWRSDSSCPFCMAFYMFRGCYCNIQTCPHTVTFWSIFMRLHTSSSLNISVNMLSGCLLSLIILTSPSPTYNCTLSSWLCFCFCPLVFTFYCNSMMWLTPIQFVSHKKPQIIFCKFLLVWCGHTCLIVAYFEHHMR